MTAEIVKDIGEIYTRLFDHRAFTSGEINYFLKEFEEKRSDREVENLFTSFQNTSEIRDTAISRCKLASETHLPVLQSRLEKTLASCQAIIDQEPDKNLEQKLKTNRESRIKIWQHFIDDMTHKCSRVDNTFEEKEEELREFYSDLERKLHIHK